MPAPIPLVELFEEELEPPKFNPLTLLELPKRPPKLLAPLAATGLRFLVAPSVTLEYVAALRRLESAAVWKAFC